MAYLTFEEFNGFKTGVAVTEDEYATLSFYADNAVNSYIRYEMKNPDLNFKVAVAMQIALSKQNGGMGYYSEMSGGLQHESLGDYSYSVGTNSSEQANFGLFPMVANLLARYRRNTTPVKVRL